MTKKNKALPIDTPKVSAPKDRVVTVQIANVWTSKGKHTKGETVFLSAGEIKELGDAVK